VRVTVHFFSHTLISNWFSFKFEAVSSSTGYSIVPDTMMESLGVCHHYKSDKYLLIVSTHNSLINSAQLLHVYQVPSFTSHFICFKKYVKLVKISTSHSLAYRMTIFRHSALYLSIPIFSTSSGPRIPSTLSISYSYDNKTTI